MYGRHCFAPVIAGLGLGILLGASPLPNYASADEPIIHDVESPAEAPYFARCLGLDITLPAEFQRTSCMADSAEWTGAVAGNTYWLDVVKLDQSQFDQLAWTQLLTPSNDLLESGWRTATKRAGCCAAYIGCELYTNGGTRIWALYANDEKVYNQNRATCLISDGTHVWIAFLSFDDGGDFDVAISGARTILKGIESNPIKTLSDDETAQQIELHPNAILSQSDYGSDQALIDSPSKAFSKAFGLLDCGSIHLVDTSTGNESATTLKDGIYTAEGKGIGGKVPVTVTIRNGRVANVEVGENSETQGIGTKAIEALPEAIVAANGTGGVDAVSGASVTSKAIFDAVESCLEQAGASISGLQDGFYFIDGMANNGSVSVIVDVYQSEISDVIVLGDIDYKNDTPSSSVVYADGIYTAEGKGIGGKVPVTVTVEGGKIASVEVGENSETQGIGSKAVDQLPAAIVAAGGTEGVDAVSGASVTSKAIFTAVEAALEEAAR